jgi:hypothetical protein
MPNWVIERGPDGMPCALWWAPGRDEMERKERKERDRKVRGRVYEAARAWAFARGLCDSEGYLCEPKRLLNWRG